VGDLDTDGCIIMQWIFYRQVLKLTGHIFAPIVKRHVSAVNYINLRVSKEQATSKNETPVCTKKAKQTTARFR